MLAEYSVADLPFFLALPVLLIMSGFFSGSETALFGLSSAQRLRLTKGGGVIGLAVDQLLAEPRMLLITLMLGNMVVNVLYFVISSALLLKLEGGAGDAVWAALGSVGTLVGIIVFGEVVPKLLANTARTAWVRVTALPLFALHNLIGPLRVVLAAVVIGPLARLVSPAGRPPALSADELEMLLDLSQRRGVIDPGEEQLLREVVHLGEMKVRDVMVPRVDIEAVEVGADPGELLALIRRTRRARYVAYEEDMDHVLGVIYTKQFLLARASGEIKSLRRLVRQVMYVPELVRVDQLLQTFRKRGVQFAIAVDEYGGTAGMVALKDVVERLVGDLVEDETGQEAVESLGPGVWRVSGRLPAHDWAEAFGQQTLPVRVATVGGLATALLGRMPAVGDRVQLGNLEMEVERMVGLRVESVRLRLRLRDVKAGGEA